MRPNVSRSLLKIKSNVRGFSISARIQIARDDVTQYLRDRRFLIISTITLAGLGYLSTKPDRFQLYKRIVGTAKYDNVLDAKDSPYFETTTSADLKTSLCLDNFERCELIYGPPECGKSRFLLALKVGMKNTDQIFQVRKPENDQQFAKLMNEIMLKTDTTMPFFEHFMLDKLPESFAVKYWKKARGTENSSVFISKLIETYASAYFKRTGQPFILLFDDVNSDAVMEYNKSYDILNGDVDKTVEVNWSLEI
jgi:hypothetical protein